MGDGAVANTQSVEMQARWIASLMAPGDGPSAVQTPVQEPRPTMPGDRTSRAANRGNASPTVAIPSSHAVAATGQAQAPASTAQPQLALQAPPELFTNDQGQVVTGDGQPYLGMQIYRSEGFVNAQGQQVDLNAVLQQTGLKADQLSVNERNELVKQDGSPALPGQTISVVSGYVDAQGNPVDLESEERKRGIGVAEQPAPTTGAADPAADPNADPNAAMVDYNKLDAAGRPQIVYPNGQPYLGRELFVDEATGAIFDKEGKSVDPATLGAPQGPTPEEQKLARRIQQGTAVASGAFNLYMNRVWYNSTLPGMQGRLASLQRSSTAFKTGNSWQSKLQNTPVVGGLVNRAQVKRETKIDKLQRSIKLQQMTPKQEAIFMAKERLATLKAESAAFKRGEGMMGRLKNAPVVGKYAQKAEANRQVQIRQVRTQIKTGNIETTWKTKVANATRGRVMPALMAIGSGWSTYTEIRDTRRRADDPTNVRKWDDYARITGGAVQTGGALMALKRGNVKGAIVTATVGTLVSTVGEFFRD